MSDSWDGCDMVCGVIRKADLIEYLEQSRALLRDAIFDGRRGLNAAVDAMSATSLVADATTFLKALGAKWNDQWWALVKAQQQKGASAMAVGSREWAAAKCKEWNWNLNAAEIAKELIDAGIEHDSRELANVKRAFLKFYARGADECQEWEFIEQSVEVFGG